ncbi:hypothetical protein AB0D56_09670 [Streptomyces sp. NPDC048209]|uniref:hypothetical protein n=1 Tax=Streptomyces sp. NPDC048209 TaxID=3156689 RepID=UPI0034461F3A
MVHSISPQPPNDTSAVSPASHRDPSRREELRFILMHGGAQTESIADRIIDLAIAEAQIEAAIWLRSVGETDAAYLLSTCDVWVNDETRAAHGPSRDLRPGAEAARRIIRDRQEAQS